MRYPPHQQVMQEEDMRLSGHPDVAEAEDVVVETPAIMVGEATQDKQTDTPRFLKETLMQ